MKIDLGKPGDPYLMISAWRSERETWINLELTQRLLRQLLNGGFYFEPTISSYHGIKELSFAVYVQNYTEYNHLLKIAWGYDQDEVYYVGATRHAYSIFRGGAMVPREGIVKEISPEDTARLGGWTTDLDGHYYSNESVAF